MNKHLLSLLEIYYIRLRLISAVFLLLATIGLNIGVPLILREVINVISLQPSVLIFAEVLLFLYGFAWTLSKVTDQLRLVAMNRVVERGIRQLCLDVFNHLIHLSLRFHHDRKMGALLNAIDRAQFAFPGFVWGLFFLILSDPHV
ncbi:MAG: hypothetical protein H0U71_07940 [Gammaproteobacteria bacterium]|nr:hypothetical protein [Gammaproteobacteria bacterium]